MSVGIAQVLLQSTAHAAPYPTKTIRFIIGFPPGGSPDIVARRYAAALTTKLGQQVIVENRPGAGTLIATEAAVKAAPDGYSLFLGTGSVVTNGVLKKDLTFNPLEALKTVTFLYRVPWCIVVSPSLGVSSLKDLVKMAKENPGKLRYGSTGVGGQAHFLGEYLKKLTGTNIRHVPYTGGATSLTDVITGQIEISIAELLGARARSANGELKILAVSSAERSPVLPEVPTIREQGIDIEFDSFALVFVPAGTPDDIVKQLHEAISAVSADAEFRDTMIKNGVDLVVSSPEEGQKYYQRQFELYKSLVSAIEVKVE
jgi:tripartite-type tricarboxylate transporter receptor subunit TctC